MTCPTCQPLAATTRAQLDNRLRDIRDFQAGFEKCPHCAGIDWGTAEDSIGSTNPSFVHVPTQALPAKQPSVLVTVLEAVGECFWGIVLVLSILLFTPIGGVVKVFVVVGSILGAGKLVIGALDDLLNFNWRGTGAKLLGVIALLILMAVSVVVLPLPPVGRGCYHDRYNDFCD